MLKIFKNEYFCFKVLKTNTKKEKLLLLISENIGDRVLSVLQAKIPSEYREKGIRCFKN